MEERRSKRAATAVEIRCEECQRPWHDPLERWRMYLTDDPDPYAVPYCPVCAAREFGYR
jgi:hypothetical protein